MQVIRPEISSRENKLPKDSIAINLARSPVVSIKKKYSEFRLAKRDEDMSDEE